MGGGGEGVWKSTDYGNTWKKINDSVGYVPMGYVMPCSPVRPRRSSSAGYKVNHKSIDGGVTYKDIPLRPSPIRSTRFRSILTIRRTCISGLHEADGIVESTDGGDTWTYVGKTGFPSGGNSWYVFFLDTGTAATTRTTWFAIAQDGGSAVMTSNAGAVGDSRRESTGSATRTATRSFFSRGNTMFVPGIGGPGDGLYKSTDWARLQQGSRGRAVRSRGARPRTSTRCGVGRARSAISARAFTWRALPAPPVHQASVPAASTSVRNTSSVTSDGKHNIFVGTMWSAGVWRYVEP